MKSSDRYFADNIYCMVEGEKLRVSNLSPGGLFAVSYHPPALGDIVIVELHLNHKAGFRVIGEVSWTNDPVAPTTSALPPGFGLRFTSLAEGDKLALQEILKRSDPVLRQPPSLN